MKQNRKRQRTRIACKIDDLPDGLKNNVIELLSDTRNSYVSISEFLKSEGYSISKSAIGRYALRIGATLQRLQEAQEQTKTLIEVIRRNPEGDYTDAALQIMIGELTKKFATAQEEWDDMPLDKAGRLAVAISRTATYKDKFKEDQKKKSEIAFREMEKKILETIKADDMLAAELHCILLTAKEMMMKDD